MKEIGKPTGVELLVEEEEMEKVEKKKRNREKEEKGICMKGDGHPLTCVYINMPTHFVF